MFFLAAFLIFSVALFGAGYYLWSVPEHQATNMLGARLRELRAHMRGRSRAPRNCCGASSAAPSRFWATW